MSYLIIAVYQCSKQDIPTYIRNAEKPLPYPKFDINLVESFQKNLGADSQFQILQREISDKNQSNPSQKEIDTWVDSFKSLILVNAKKTFHHITGTNSIRKRNINRPAGSTTNVIGQRTNLKGP